MSEAAAHGYTVLIALVGFLAVSVWLGTLAQRAISRANYLESFFLGNRGLGAWAMALTATVQSGGTFMGYPALVYDYGWVGLLWISSYMVVPLTGFAVVGKRLAQLSRRTGAVTVPDVFSARFADHRVGLCASLMIIFLLSFTMCAQFKAGATVMKLAWPGETPFAFAEEAQVTIDTKYYVGLVVFAITVVGYTMIGGFLASVWTDLFQSLMMVIGVLILFGLTLAAVGGLEQATWKAIEHTGPGYALPPGFHEHRKFLTPGLAVSMFVMWVYSGLSSPASMVRVMAAQNAEVLRKSIVILTLYNCLIYIPLAIIAISGRALYPHEKPDEIIPALAMRLTASIPGGSLISALILAAPFGAIMASVSCFILVIASGIVKDLYLRYVHPQANAHEIQRATNLAMLVIGTLAVLAVIHPPRYLQVLIVFSSSVGAAVFFFPLMMACYWRRATAAGIVSAMMTGFWIYVLLFALGLLQGWAEQSPGTLATTIISILGKDPQIGPDTALRPYYLLGFDPVIWGMLGSGLAGWMVSLLTCPPSEPHLKRVYD